MSDRGFGPVARSVPLSCRSRVGVYCSTFGKGYCLPDLVGAKGLDCIKPAGLTSILARDSAMWSMWPAMGTCELRSQLTPLF